MEGNAVVLDVLQWPQTVSAESESDSVWCEICPLKKENRELRCERGYWEKQHQRAREREEKLREEIQQLKARIRYLKKEGASDFCVGSGV